MAPPPNQQRSFESEARSRQQEYAMELQQQMREKDKTGRMPFGSGSYAVLIILVHVL
jgi:hypothetical protein